MKKLFALIFTGILLFGCLGIGGEQPQQTAQAEKQSKAVEQAQQQPASPQPAVETAAQDAGSDLGLPSKEKLEDLKKTFEDTSKLDEVSAQLDALLK